MCTILRAARYTVELSELSYGVEGVIVGYEYVVACMAGILKRVRRLGVELISDPSTLHTDLYNVLEGDFPQTGIFGT